MQKCALYAPTAGIAKLVTMATIQYDFRQWLDLAAFGWFLLCWIGYARYAKRCSAREVCLASVMHLYRKDWMLRMSRRDNRMADMSAIGTLERNVTFFASSSLIILAGILTLMGYLDKAISIFTDLPFAAAQTRYEMEFKVALLLAIFVYAFFKFTWSMRQYGFASVLVGATPVYDEADVSRQQIEDNAERVARILSMAAHHFNFGMRSYYFALAVLAWLVSSWLFIAATTTVVGVLYRREYRSAALRTLMSTQQTAPRAPRT